MSYGYTTRIDRLNKEADGRLLGVKLGLNLGSVGKLSITGLWASMNLMKNYVN